MRKSTWTILAAGAALVLLVVLLPSISDPPGATHAMRAPQPAPPAAQAGPARRGAILTTRAGYLPICLATREALREAIRWWDTDREEVARAMLRHGGQVLATGTRVKLLEPGLLAARVRVLDTDRECYCIRELVDP